MNIVDDTRGNIAVGIIILTITVLAVIFVGWVWTQLYPAVSGSLTLGELDAQLGVDPSGTTIFFTALAFIGLIAGMIVWFIMRPLNSDIRQSIRPR